MYNYILSGHFPSYHSLYCIAIILLSLPGTNLRAQTAYHVSGFEIADFQYEKVGLAGSNTYQFFPMCKDNDTPELRRCNGGELGLHTYFWDFGDGDYSFEAQPIKQFINRGSNLKEYQITLRVTNTKEEDDPDLRKAALDENRKEILVKRKTTWVSTVPNPPNLSIPCAELIASHAPVPSYRIRYGIRLYNPNPSRGNFSGSFDFPSGLLEPESFNPELWNGESTHPSGLITRTGPTTYSFSDVYIRPYQIRTLIFEFKVNKNALVGQILPFKLFAKDTIQCKRTQDYEWTTVQSLDPNTKSISNPCPEPGQEVDITITFENEGNIPEEIIMVQDTLNDDVFDLSTISNIRAEVGGIDLSPSSIFPNHDPATNTAYWKLTPASPYLLPGNSGSITFSIKTKNPVYCSEGYPCILQCDSSGCYSFYNQATIRFSDDPMKHYSNELLISIECSEQNPINKYLVYFGITCLIAIVGWRFLRWRRRKKMTPKP